MEAGKSWLGESTVLGKSQLETASLTEERKGKAQEWRHTERRNNRREGRKQRSMGIIMQEQGRFSDKKHEVLYLA